MHIAHFVQRYPPALGGSESYFQRLSRYFAAQGHNVTVWTTTAIDLEAFWSQRAQSLTADTIMDGEVRVRRFAVWRWPLRRYILKALSLFPAPTWQALTLPANPISPDMWKAAGRDMEPCDMVHAAAFPYAFPIACARRLAQRRGVPFVLTPFLHLGDPADATNRMRRSYLSRPLLHLLKSADRVMVQTPSERRAVIESGIAEDRVVLQGLGVDSADCTGGSRALARQNWGITESEVVVGHLANLSFEKGTIDLLRAAQTLWESGQKFRVVLAGPDMGNFRRFWESYGMKDRVVKLGVLDDQQKREFFAAIDIFALPSRSDSFGLVLLEAWANRVPNIAYRAGGVADLIQHDLDGILVTCGEVPELAAGLKRLIANPDRRRILGNCGHERVAKDFRWRDKLSIVQTEYDCLKRQLASAVSKSR